jgi:hypothetical protein
MICAGAPAAMRSVRRTLPLLATTALLTSTVILRAGAVAESQDAAALIARVGERVAAYYQRAQQLICLERATVVPIEKDWSVQGFARTVESELRVERDGMDDGTLPAARITRQILRVNGRAPRERDKTDDSGCTDPTPVSPDLLTFLLPGHRDQYRFTTVREGREQNRAALIIDFASAGVKSRPRLVEDEYGHDDCFDWEGPVATAGRLWVDAATHDVLRLDRRINGPTDIAVPSPLQRKYRFDPYLTIDRDDVTMRYKEVTFTDPAETLLLPESIQSVTVLRTTLQSTRRTQVFSDYRRFLTASRIKGK